MWWYLLVANAVEPEFVWERPEPPSLVRVDTSDYPGALAFSAHGSVLETPPDGDVPWRPEPIPVVDGIPAQAAIDALNADLWHEAGWRGQGVRIAVFDIHWFGAEADPSVLGDVTTADCWTHSSCEVAMDTSFARFGYEEGVHGYACAEIIRDIAPDAELFLVRVNGLTTFENAIDWAIRNDIDLISMSMSFFNSSFYDGTGPFGPPMEALAANDVLMVTSSGNYAREHWSGRWLDQDSDGWLDFDGDNQLELSMTSGNRRTVYFTWDEHQRCGESDLDAYIYDGEGNVLGASETVQDDENRRCEPVERVRANIPSNGSYWLRVRAQRVVAPYLEVDVFTQNGSIPAAVPGWSIADPGAHREAFTVGAVRAEGYLTADIESFSSWGPVRSGWDKPDIAGPDGLTVNAYGAEGFYGTSAATPAVAAALALVMSREPELTPKQAGQRLKSWALNDDPLGRQDDPRWGAGKARLPVPEPSFGGCGRGRLWAIVFLPPIAWRRRRSDTSVG